MRLYPELPDIRPDFMLTKKSSYGYKLVFINTSICIWYCRISSQLTNLLSRLVYLWTITGVHKYKYLEDFTAGYVIKYIVYARYPTNLLTKRIPIIPPPDCSI